MLSPTAFAGDVVLIVDARSAVARAVAQGLEHSGARIAVAGGSAEATWFDAGVAPHTLSQVGAAFDGVEQAIGPVTILIHAGLLSAAAAFGAAETTDALNDSASRDLFAWARTLATRRTADGRAATILAIGRSMANKGGLGLMELATNQAAVEAQIKAYAAEWARHGIRANLLLAGLVKGDSFPDPLPDGVTRDSLAPAGRVADPVEIARPALYLCSRYAAYVTGATVVADGGYAIKRSNSGPAYDPVAVFTGGPMPAIISP